MQRDTTLTKKENSASFHGPLRFITSHLFRARLCHAKNEAPEEEAGIKAYKEWPWGLKEWPCVTLIPDLSPG